jgi:hypothetical protein
MSDADARAYEKAKDIMINGGGCKLVGQTHANVSEGMLFGLTGWTYSDIDMGSGVLNKLHASGATGACKAVMKEQY